MDAVDPRRLSFYIGSSQADHLLAYQQSDLILDPFPHSGGTCCLEQLWMGVPMVTLYGTQAAGRTASSVLKCLGYSQLVATDRESYIAAATSLARSPGSLNAYRIALRERLLSSPVVKGYVAAVENLYVELIKERAGCVTTK